MCIAFFNFLYLITLNAILADSQELSSGPGDGRIIGGDSTPIEDVPYQASLGTNGMHVCGASIISERHLLTAAHCIQGSIPEDYTIRVGSTSPTERGQLLNVSEIISHDNYSPQNMDYDITIVKTASPITFDNSVSPITLADAGEELEDGALAIVSGWGAVKEGGSTIDVLQKVPVPHINQTECQNAHGEKNEITARMLCAGGLTEGTDACQGDSGGPLAYNGKQYGVVSWGIGCGRPGVPGVYTKVANLRDWIDQTIQ